MTRPPARDQPSAEETAWLVSRLRAVAELAARRDASRVVRAPDGVRRVWWRIIAARAELDLVEHGRILEERTLPATEVLAAIEEDGPDWGTLAGLFDR